VSVLQQRFRLTLHIQIFNYVTGGRMALYNSNMGVLLSPVTKRIKGKNNKVVEENYKNFLYNRVSGE
jgi:hypothetical protein